MPDTSIKCLFEIIGELAVVELNGEFGRRIMVFTVPPIAYRLERNGTLSSIEVDDVE